MNCCVGRRRGLDPALLWLWCTAAAVAPIGPLPWELPYALGVALKRKKKVIRTILEFSCGAAAGEKSAMLPEELVVTLQQEGGACSEP